METKLTTYADLIPPPFTFNPLKHHLGFIRELIHKTGKEISKEEFFRLINEISSQLTDIYTGNYPVNRLLEIMRMQLIHINSYEKSAYQDWVNNSGKHYNFLELPDKSRWTFRLGEKEGRYIHFHPARLSSSFRIRGTTLKTALAIKILAAGNVLLYNDTYFINDVRKNLLDLSPVKDIKHFTAMKKILDLMKE